MATAFVQGNVASGSGSSGSIAVTLPSVAAGTLVSLALKYEGLTTTSSISDGLGSSVVALTEKRNANDDVCERIFYVLSSGGSGSTVTYTCTFGASRPFRSLQVMNFSYSGTCTFEAEASGGGGEGTSNAAASGNVTATGADIISFAGYASYGAVSSNRQIDGVAADGSQSDAIDCASWYRLITSGYTGQATAALSKTEAWVLNLATFKVTGGGGGTVGRLVGGTLCGGVLANGLLSGEAA